MAKLTPKTRQPGPAVAFDLPHLPA